MQDQMEMINGKQSKAFDTDELVELITSGKASIDVAYATGMRMIGYACSLAGDIDLSNVEELTRDEVDKRLDLVSSARAYVKSVALMFAKYPLVESSALNLANIIFYAESCLIPAMLLGSIEAKAAARDVSTYIIRNPQSGLIKIGKTCHLKTRIASLQTGSGIDLQVLAVIDGDIERDLHKTFSDLRVHGEWFKDRDGSIAAFAAAQGGE